ncbi:MAG: superoxide dismutase, Ni [Candidatus Altiarchaeota archaeon]|nr:superoxide dismutase, Ni [Candidatus Altiarchaeota archaeon]
MMHGLLKKIDSLIGFREASAHCDVPCGIYDPHLTQLAAHTVIRMTKLIKAFPEPTKNEHVHRIVRYTQVKDEYAELCKHELRILFGDYFKEKHIQEYPELPKLFVNALRLASKARQEINTEASNELLTTVQKIAEIFWKTKGLEPVRVKSPYPTGGEMVLHK